MEDILASIRKIIAQDDTRARPVDTAAQPPSAPAASQAAPAPTANGMAQPRPAAQPHPSDAMGQPSYRTQTAPRPATTLAALANQVRQEMPRSQPPAPNGSAASAPAAQAPSPAPAAAPVRPSSAQPATAAVQAQPSAPPVQKAPQQAAMEEAAFREALASPSTTKAVNDSFDRLKAAVSDDTAAKVEAVLRPMLREWLDNNLPGMVERLVREEIQRISRR